MSNKQLITEQLAKGVGADIADQARSKRACTSACSWSEILGCDARKTGDTARLTPMLTGVLPSPARGAEPLPSNNEKLAYGREQSGGHSPDLRPGNRQPQERQHSAANGGTRDRLPPARGAASLCPLCPLCLCRCASRCIDSRFQIVFHCRFVWTVANEPSPAASRFFSRHWSSRIRKHQQPRLKISFGMKPCPHLCVGRKHSGRQITTNVCPLCPLCHQGSPALRLKRQVD